MTATQQKLDEFELLESIYPEFTEVDTEDRAKCVELASNPCECPVLRLHLNFSVLKLCVELPSGYPECEAAELRFEWTNLSTNQENELLQQLTDISTDSLGEGSLLTIVSAVTDYIDSISSDSCEETVTPDVTVSLNRLWYYAHHIYSKEKRSNMVKWSRELDLTGFILPGKPGVICIEGSVANCREFNVRVRAMNWQLLKLQHDERELEGRLFTDFGEMIFDVHGRANNHQDLGQFRTFLEDKQLGEIFTILFGF
eukprot:sb/3468574/